MTLRTRAGRQPYRDIHLAQAVVEREHCSRFTLRLAVGTARDLPRKDVGPDLSSRRFELRGKRVLLVEDNEFNRLLAAVVLTNVGLCVTEAANGETAVKLAKTSRSI